jgi:hypothetical protein
MGNVLKNVFKAALIGFAVGMSLSLIAPGIASLTGANPAMLGNFINPLFTGTFVATLNAITAVVAPVVSKVFGGLDKQPNDQSKEIVAEKSPAVSIMTEKSQTPEKPCAKKFRDAVEVERATAQTGRGIS